MSEATSGAIPHIAALMRATGVSSAPCIRANAFTSPRVRGERLSFWSSVFELPWGFISQDRVEDGEEFSCNSDDGDELGLAGSDEPVTEQLERRIEARGDHGAHEQDPPYVGPAAADEAFASPLAGLPGPGCKSHEGCNLPAVE